MKELTILKLLAWSILAEHVKIPPIQNHIENGSPVKVLRYHRQIQQYEYR